MNIILSRVHALKLPVSILASYLLWFCVVMISSNIYAAAGPPTIGQCENRWRLSNVTTGMAFGDFSVEPGAAGGIILNPGSSRTAIGTIDLVSAGSAVNSHQISVENRRDPDCSLHGIVFDWTVEPVSMTRAGGAPILLSNSLVHIEGTAYTLPTPTLYIDPAALPLSIEITARMDAADPQAAGAYRSDRYTFTLFQGAGSSDRRGRARTTSITPLTLTPGNAMDFGTVAAGSVATTVSVNAAGAVTAPAGPGNAVVIVSAGAALTFGLQGASGLSYDLTLNDGTLDDIGAGAAMAVTITGDDRPATLDGNVQTVTVTGDLTVGANQAKGSYATNIGSGTPIVITVNYN